MIGFYKHYLDETKRDAFYQDVISDLLGGTECTLRITDEKAPQDMAGPYFLNINSQKIVLEIKPKTDKNHQKYTYRFDTHTLDKPFMGETASIARFFALVERMITASKYHVLECQYITGDLISVSEA